MAYSKATLKNSGDKASPCFKPFWIVRPSDKCLPVLTLLCISFKRFVISLTHFMGVSKLSKNIVQYFPPH
jgi:hypothetical protein